jgi:regulator of sigma E protease
MIITVIIFIILLGVLVLVHEWGHFFVARRFGVRVEEFAFGFPPRLASFVKNGTRYAFNLIPLGGYVKIYGEGGEGGSDPESFTTRPIRQRILIIAAGVFMNIVLAWFLFSLGHGLGLPTVVGEADHVDQARVSIIGIAPGSPAEQAKFIFGDSVVSLGTASEHVAIQTIEQVQEFVEAHRGIPITVGVLRGRERVELTVTPRIEVPSEEGPLGIAMARIGIVRAPWWRAPWDGAKTTASAFVAITTSLWGALHDFVVRGSVPAEISGPVGIFVFADESRRLGLVYLIELAGVLSVNLALLNILPIPALDGGRILFLFIEKVRGVRINQRIEQLVHTIGFAVLLALMVAITYRDIVRIF